MKLCEFPKAGGCWREAVQWCPTLQKWLCYRCASLFGCYDDPLAKHYVGMPVVIKQVAPEPRFIKV